MKVLAITNMYPTAEFPSRGIVVQEQIKSLRSAGLDVRVLFVDRRRDGPMVYFRRLRIEVRRVVAEFKPDVIHAMYGGVMADQITRHHHLRPVVVTFRGSDLLGENLSGWARKIVSRFGMFCSRRAAKSSDGVIVVARHLIDALNGAAKADKIRVIPSGVDLERFRPMDSLACRKKLGWDERSFHVLFASNNGDPVKRPWLAQGAAQICRAEFHHMTGISMKEVPSWLNAADALLMTSLHEGSPNIVKEALACGLPVVSVDVGDVAERIGGIAGCHLAAAEPAALVAKLELVRQCGERLDCHARLKEFSIQNTAEKLKQFYEEIIRKNRARESRAAQNHLSIPVVFPVEQETAFAKEILRPKRRAETILKTIRREPAIHA